MESITKAGGCELLLEPELAPFGKSTKRNVEPSELSFNHMIAWVALSRLGPVSVEELDAAEFAVELDVEFGGYAPPVRYKMSPG